MGVPNFISKNLVQDLTHWANPVTGGSGTDTFDAPVSIKARLEEKNEVVVTHSGEEIVSGGTAITAINVFEGEYLYLGTSVETDPRKVPGAMRILVATKIPQLRSTTDFLYRAHLNMDEQ